MAEIPWTETSSGYAFRVLPDGSVEARAPIGAGGLMRAVVQQFEHHALFAGYLRALITHAEELRRKVSCEVSDAGAAAEECGDCAVCWEVAAFERAAERDAAQAELAQLRARAAWIKTADRLPTAADHPAGPTRQDAWGKEIPVDHVPCLVVLRKYPQDVYFLQWNTHHGCWDDAHGDDFSAHASDAIHWMPAPKAPAEVSRG